MTCMLDPANNPDLTKMSMPEIEATTGLLLLGGSETTGTTICGTINCLIQNPVELRKLETEIRNCFEKEEHITLSALQQLPFLNAVIQEGLRLCNPVSGGILRIAPPGGGSVCGYFLPEGVSDDCSLLLYPNVLTISMRLDTHSMQHCLHGPQLQKFPPQS